MSAVVSQDTQASKTAGIALPVVSLEHGKKSFGNTRVLRDISLSIDKGDVLAIIGPSGGGKSTLLRCLTLLERLDGGTLAYGSLVVAKNEDGAAHYGGPAVEHEARNRFGLVFQNFNLFPHYTVLENLCDPQIRVLKRSQKEAEARARKLLDRMDLGGKESMVPCELSGGQQQRVAIGRALMNAPAVVLADEPTGNLDTRNSGEIMQLLRDSNREFGQTMIVITHDEEIALAADRIIAVEDGRIVRDERIRR